MLAVPLRYGSRVVGVIVVSKLGLDQFDEDDMRLLEVLAGHAAVAVENARLYEAARREAESATSLLEFGRELATAANLDDILRARRRADGGPARVAAHLGLARRTPTASSRRASCTATRRRSARASSRAASTRPRAERLAPARSRSCSARTTWSRIETSRSRPTRPTRSRRSTVEGRVGCIVAALPAGDFGERELRLLGGLAHQAKLAIANASNYEGLEQTFVSTVEALANALEANDEYTSTHARWITDLALRVGGELGLDERGAEAARARRAAARHRQDRHPERHPLEAGPAHRRGARA